ncbi:hypothetical protein PF011_g22042 [Phytophthora fragariae]|uniref:Uncharacterized protein n=1 Tax=Phytophthora fragariae TaxID=53985 RepID=A0A6A3IHB8_9STRA|nr:hypothetical protein PF011_g22042 [Phytophthora fragariae]
MFTQYAAVVAASAHICLGSPKCSSKHLILSVIVRIIRSATPFCSGVCFTVSEHFIP